MYFNIFLAGNTELNSLKRVLGGVYRVITLYVCPQICGFFSPAELKRFGEYHKNLTMNISLFMFRRLL